MWWQLLIVFLTMNDVGLAAFNSQCETTGWSCKNCRSLNYCLGIFVWNTRDCGPSEYCNPNTNSCQKDVPTECEVEKFKCTISGTYPDIENCGKYIMCNTSDPYKFVTKSCPNRYVYDHYFKKCVLKLDHKNCNAPLCSDDEYKSYPNDLSIYIACRANPPILKICKPGYIFKNDRQSCVKECNSSLKVESSDCSKFYECSDKTVYERQCELGTGFNPFTHACDKNYAHLCKEQALFNQTVQQMPIYTKNFFVSINNVFQKYNYSVVTFLNLLGISQVIITDAIVVLNHLTETGKVPRVLLEIILGFVPDNYKKLVTEVMSMFFLVVEIPFLKSNILIKFLSNRRY